MPVHIERVINEITPENSDGADSAQVEDRWRKRLEMIAIRDEQEFLVQRLAAEDFDD